MTTHKSALIPKMLILATASLTANLSMGAQKHVLTAQIIDRQDEGNTVSIVRQGHSGFHLMNYVSSSGTSAAYSQTIVSRQFTLLLPDHRVVVVICAGKYAPHLDYVNERSCRQPLVDTVQVEFKKDNAKLQWQASIDGSKRESETYKILSVHAYEPDCETSASPASRVPTPTSPATPVIAAASAPMATPTVVVGPTVPAGTEATSVAPVSAATVVAPSVPIPSATVNRSRCDPATGWCIAQTR